MWLLFYETFLCWIVFTRNGTHKAYPVGMRPASTAVQRTNCFAMRITLGTRQQCGVPFLTAIENAEKFKLCDLQVQHAMCDRCLKGIEARAITILFIFCASSQQSMESMSLLAPVAPCVLTLLELIYWIDFMFILYSSRNSSLKSRNFKGQGLSV